MEWKTNEQKKKKIVVASTQFSFAQKTQLTSTYVCVHAVYYCRLIDYDL
jgi:hypothetical protein